MDKKNNSEIKELYSSYGFNLFYEDDDIIVFTYERGYFRNAEILIIGEESNSLNDIKSQLKDANYGLKTERFSSVNKLHDNLFKGFFNSDSYKCRINKKYFEYTDKLTQNLGTEYEYVKCNYLLNGEYINEDIIDRIISELNQDGPVLIIIEAPAGYGKTCTSYELLKRINDEYDEFKIPLLTELSLNRTAKIFKYVLLDEIDRCFSNVDLTLVKREISEGKIPLIIDGLDELITKGQSSKNSLSVSDHPMDDISSMLNTISDLLENQSKIILTSRKSAMFTGEKFTKWLYDEGITYPICRIVLREPSVKDWIGGGKHQYINARNTDIEKISNPVILSYLRSLNEDDFESLCCSNERLINSFFTKLLKREIDRQSLKLSVKEQLEVFTKLAMHMAAEDFSSDTREMMKEHILYANIDLIEKSKQRYIGIERKDVESIANTLAGHALLDKVGIYDQVSFINEFVFGCLLGDGLIADSNENEFMDFKYIDLACTAYKGRSDIKKKKLMSIFDKYMAAMLGTERLLIEINLNVEVIGEYKNESFSEIDFKDFSLTKSNRFKNCTFYNCTFIKTNLNKECFKETTFMNCKFYECNIAESSSKCKNRVLACVGDFLDRLKDEEEKKPTIDEFRYERIVIEKFWPIGKAQAQTNRAMGKMLRGVDPSEHDKVQLAIESLCKKGIIRIDSEVLILNLSRMREIIEIKNSGVDN